MSVEIQSSIPQIFKPAANLGRLMPDQTQIIPSAFKLGDLKISSMRVHVKKDSQKEDSSTTTIANDNPIVFLSPNAQKNTMKGRRGTIRPAVKSILTKWLWEHTSNPYPSTKTMNEFIIKTGLTKKQIQTWFVNARIRLLDDVPGKNPKKEEKVNLVAAIKDPVPQLNLTQ